MDLERDYDVEGQIQQWETERGALSIERIEALHVPPVFLDIQRRLAVIEKFLGLWPKPVNADLPST